MENIEQLAKSRLRICKECPIYSNKNDGTCNNKLYLRPDTNEVSTYKLENFIRGCGCILSSKVKSEFSSCPAGKW